MSSRCGALGKRRSLLTTRKPEQAAPPKALIREALFCQLLSASGPPLQRQRAGARQRCRRILFRSGEAPLLKARARSSASEFVTLRLALLKMLRSRTLTEGLLLMLSLIREFTLRKPADLE